MGSRTKTAAGLSFSQEKYNDNNVMHNSYPLINNQNANLSKAERDHIMLFNPLNDGLSGSLTGTK